MSGEERILKICIVGEPNISVKFGNLTADQKADEKWHLKTLGR